MLEVEKLINNISIEKFLFHIRGVICRFVRGRSNFKGNRTSDDKTRLFIFPGTTLSLIEPGSNRCKDNSLPASLLPVSRIPNSIHLWSASIGEPKFPFFIRRIVFRSRTTRFHDKSPGRLSKSPGDESIEGFANGWNLNSNRGEDRLEKNYKRMRGDGHLLDLDPSSLFKKRGL